MGSIFFVYFALGLMVNARNNRAAMLQYSIPDQSKPLNMMLIIDSAFLFLIIRLNALFRSPIGIAIQSKDFFDDSLVQFCSPFINARQEQS